MKTFVALLLLATLSACTGAPNESSLAATDDLPASFDWTNPTDAASKQAEPCAAVIGRIQDQGGCVGATVSMPVAELIRDRLCIQTKGVFDTDLSAQQILNCSDPFGNQGCSGGLPDFSIEYVSKNGICTAAEVPYKNQPQTCQPCKPVAHAAKPWKPSGSPAPDEEMKREIFSRGPIVAAVASENQKFYEYKGGIVDASSCGKNVEHIVRIVGWGFEGRRPYWKVANTWGASWGENGFMRIARGRNACLINTYVTAPTELKPE